MQGFCGKALLLYKALVTVKDAFYNKSEIQRGYKMFLITFDLVLQGHKKQNWASLKQYDKSMLPNNFQKYCIIKSSETRELHYETSVRTKRSLVIQTFEVRLRRADGTTIWFQMKSLRESPQGTSWLPWWDGELRRWISSRILQSSERTKCHIQMIVTPKRI